MLAAPGRPGVREIVKRFGVALNTVVRIGAAELGLVWRGRLLRPPPQFRWSAMST
jgi:hypothetical protein